MKRKFLEDLGLEKDVIDKIMAEHGVAVQAAKPEDYDTLKTANTDLTNKVTELEASLATSQTEKSEFETSVAELNGKIKAYESKELRLKVARENGIPFELSERLKGETEDELKVDAVSLATLVSKKTTKLPLKGEETNKDDNPYKRMLSGLKGE